MDEVQHLRPHVYPSQYKHKPEIDPFCATVVVILPPGYVGCTLVGFQWEKHKDPVHKYRYVAQQALRAVNFGMGV